MCHPSANRIKNRYQASNKKRGAMNRHTQVINDRYEALMFARSSEQARTAARELVRVVLG